VVNGKGGGGRFPQSSGGKEGINVGRRRNRKAEKIYQRARPKRKERPISGVEEKTMQKRGFEGVSDLAEKNRKKETEKKWLDSKRKNQLQLGGNSTLIGTTPYKKSIRRYTKGNLSLKEKNVPYRKKSGQP